MSGPVDVLAVMGSFLMFGGTIEPRRAVLEWNTPRPTSLIANRARYIAKAKTPTTATTLRELQRAEREGLVLCVGTGDEHCHAWNKSAADSRERYWVIADEALARVGGAS